MNPTTPTDSECESVLDARALDALVKTRNFSTEKVQLLLRLKEKILLAMGLVLGQWRESRDPVSGAFAEHCQAEIKLAEERQINDILRGRFARMPPARRKRYSPEERFRIVLFVRSYGISFQQAADSFLVDPQTIARWVHEATREPDKKTVGPLLKATPPLRSFDDVTRQLIADLDLMGVGGSKTIAQMLRRAGVKIARETVRRYRKARHRDASASPLSRRWRRASDRGGHTFDRLPQEAQNRINNQQPADQEASRPEQPPHNTPRRIVFNRSFLLS